MSDYKLVPKSIVDELAQFIRKVDGNNRMGAGALAEKICERFRVDVAAVQGEPVGYVRPHQLEALRSGKACGITLEDKPDAHNRVTIPLYAVPQPPLQLPDFATDPDDSDEVASLWDHGFKRGWNSCLGAVAKAMQPAEQHTQPCQECGGDGAGGEHEDDCAMVQPAEQQPASDGSLTPVPDELFAAEFNAWWEQHGQFCRAGGGDYERTFAFEAWRHLYPKLMKLQKVAAEQQPALTKYQPCGCVVCTCEHETQCQGCGANHCGTHPVGQFSGPVYQQPAPDVAGLVGKMGRLIAAGNRLNAEAEECIYGDGMYEVAGSEYWCEFRDALEAATEALAAHRKQQENK